MSLVLTLVIVLVVGALIANYYPAPKTKASFAEETLTATTPEPTIPETEPVKIDEPISTPVTTVATTVEPATEAAPKMTAKPKKKRNYHNNSKKPKTNK